ncbi:MAG: TIGR02300 family protein, partial [Pseudomonadota bacterium]
MVKPEWGTKRTCPKCGTRFYDLGKEDPVSCIECGEKWTPEPGLKSKQPMPFEETPKKDAKKEEDTIDDDDLDINIDD